MESCLLTLRLSLSVILPAKWVYLGIRENCSLRHASCDKTIGKSNKQRRGTLFYGEKGGWEGLF